MKVITIKQPYASLIINGYKKYEFRSWKTKHRGKLLIHAGKQMNKQMRERVKHLNLDYPSGCIIGAVELTDCVKIDDHLLKELDDNVIIYGNKSDYEGYIWKVCNPYKFTDLISCNGKLSLWDYNIDKKNDAL